jgi:hypothetical protein
MLPLSLWKYGIWNEVELPGQFHVFKHLRFWSTAKTQLTHQL